MHTHSIEEITLKISAAEAATTNRRDFFSAGTNCKINYISSRCFFLVVLLCAQLPDGVSFDSFHCLLSSSPRFIFNFICCFFFFFAFQVFGLYFDSCSILFSSSHCLLFIIFTLTLFFLLSPPFSSTSHRRTSRVQKIDQNSSDFSSELLI